MWQTQSVWPVRPAHISVLWTVNIVSQHRAVLIIFPLNLQTITITRMLSSRGEGEDCFRDWLQFSIDFLPNTIPRKMCTCLFVKQVTWLVFSEVRHNIDMLCCHSYWTSFTSHTCYFWSLSVRCARVVSVFDVRIPRPLGYLYSITRAINHSPSLFDAPGTEAFALEQTYNILWFKLLSNILISLKRDNKRS